MDPTEVTVIVYQAKGLQGKKKAKHKYNVTFGINNNKARSENEDSQDGTPMWNTEAQIKVDDPLEPLIMKVKDKDDILGQVTLHMHELPTSKPARPKIIPLQPHKKAPDPHGELVFAAWISAYGEAKESESSTDKQKSSTLKKMKGAVSHSPLFNRKFSLSANTGGEGSSNLANQKAQMSSAGINGSQESLGSTISGFSTFSETTKKKKSTLKKLKGAFKKSPMLGGSKLPGKNSSQSCMDLSMGQQSNLMTVHNINLDGSRESLASQTSGFSNLSGLSAGKEKKTKNPFKKLKSKISKPSLDKSNSQSMHNLAFGAKAMTVTNGNMHGSSESLDKLKTSAMDKNFPNKFDLTVPKTLLNKSPVLGDERENNTLEPNGTPIFGHKRTGSDTPSMQSTGSGNKMGTPEPQQKRRMSYQTRSLRDDPRDRPKPDSSPKLSPKHTGDSELEQPEKSPSGRSLCIPRDETASNVRSPALGSSKEDIRASKNSINSLTVGKEFNHVRSSSYGGGDGNDQVFASPALPTGSDSAFFSSTPEPTGITTKNVVTDDNDNKPEISGVSPSEGTTEGGTKIIIRGSNLGVDKSDVVWLSICGANCLGTLEYFSEYKLRATTKAWKPGTGKIIIETQSGGKSKSLVDFTFVEPEPQVDESIIEEEKMPVITEEKQQRKSISPTRTNAGSTFYMETAAMKMKTEQKQLEKVNQKSIPKIVAEVQDPREQKREDPEGMTMSKEEQHRDSDKSTVDTGTEQSPQKLKSDGISSTKNNKMSIPAVRQENGPSKEELLEIIKNLKQENQTLKDDNVGMKVYMDRIIDKVIDRCPDVLCVDTSGSGK